MNLFKDRARFALFLGLLTASHVSYASYFYTVLHIQIDNETGADCQLTDQSLAYGQYDSPPPQSIISHHSQTFEASVGSIFYGPDMTLIYSCNNNNSMISFNIQRDTGITTAPLPRITILKNSGLTLIATAKLTSSLYTYNIIVLLSAVS